MTQKLARTFEELSPLLKRNALRTAKHGETRQKYFVRKVK